MKRNALEETSHALKRAKKEAAPSALYFDSSPIEVLACVLASLSNMEKTNYRVAHVPCQEILELLQVPGMLGTAVKTVCKTLCIPPVAYRHERQLRPEEVTGANNIREASEFLRTAGCTRLRALTVRSARPIKIAVCKNSAKTLEYLKIDESLVTDKQIEKIQETCRALKRISIIGNGAAVSKLLASYGNKLEWACLQRALN